MSEAKKVAIGVVRGIQSSGTISQGTETRPLGIKRSSVTCRTSEASQR